MNNKYIFHIDFDSYFVSAIRTIKPNLKNKPVAIARSEKHSVAVSVSYELKKIGVKAGSKVYEILAIEPKTIIEKPYFRLYQYLSNKIFKYLKKIFASKIEVASIDECYIVPNIILKNKEQAISYAKKIQTSVLEKFDIPITIGISLNKFYAKMTTNISKPFGIGYTDENNYKENFFKLDIEKFHGIGSKIANKLRQINIFTIGDLAKKKKNDFELLQVFKTTAYKYLDSLDIEKNSDLNFEIEQNKVMGNEITFEYQYDEIEILDKVNKIALNISNRLKEEFLLAKNLSLVVRDYSKKWKAYNKNISPTNDSREIYKHIKKLIDKNVDLNNIKGIGIRVSKLVDKDSIYNHFSLLGETKKVDEQKEKVETIIAQVNKKIKSTNVFKLSELNKKEKIKINHEINLISHSIFKK
ncbi:DNA polymerase IV [Mycoplasma sp. CSL7491-lung]|uniref:Y-family DNA polymerase n=2 Tax=unclassified Mycoplasma TaxID=2683645 RepID=UPI001C1047F5|nr:DNA polymerase IV [Mycoplasma sp. CSL7491-lung]MBU4692883.1 DNA polymerase IV [Mycoplasma sp. CSL7491-lung]